MLTHKVVVGKFSYRQFVILLLLTATLAVFVVPARFVHAAQKVGPKQYYLALGDSLAYGLQPNGDTTHGYVDDIFANLRSYGTQSLANMGCPGATTGSMLSGSCGLSHYSYSGSQLAAAVAFIKSNAGKVSPVTID